MPYADDHSSLKNILFIITITFFAEKETGQQFAAKIIDLSDSSDEGVYEATIREIDVLRMVAGHPYISKYMLNNMLYCIKRVEVIFLAPGNL